MGKVVKPLLIATAVAVNVIPGAGQIVGTAIATSLLGSSAVGALAIAGVAAWAPVVGAITAVGATAALSEVAGALSPNPKIALGQIDRLSAGVNPTAGRKMVLGAMCSIAEVTYA